MPGSGGRENLRPGLVGWGVGGEAHRDHLKPARPEGRRPPVGRDTTQGRKGPGQDREVCERTGRPASRDGNRDRSLQASQHLAAFAGSAFHFINFNL